MSKIRVDNIGNIDDNVNFEVDKVVNIAGKFADGFVFRSEGQIGITPDGQWWSYNGSLPFTVPAGTVPSEPTYTNRGDAALRSALAAPDSTVLVGGVEAGKIAGSNSIEINYTVGTTGDFSTINAALAFISLKHRQALGGRVNLLLLSGFELTQQLVIDTIDLSFVRITSQDLVVPVLASVWSGSHEDSGYKPAIAIRFGAISPIFDVIFDAGETVTADNNKAGFIVRSGAKLLSSGQSTASLGFKNLNGRGCYVFQNATAQINFADFQGCFVGHRCSNQGFSQIRWGNVSNCVSFGLMCDSSYINASSITGDGCGSFAIATNNGNLMCINAVAKNCLTNAVQCVDGGKITATNADFSGSGPALVAVGGQLNGNGLNLSGGIGDGIYARTGAIVNAPSANLSNRSTGIRARFGAKVEATNVTATDCVFGVISENSEVYCENATLTNCGTGLYSNLSGLIVANAANVSGATNTGVNATSGGEVRARGIIANNCARPAQASAGGIIKMTGGSATARTSQIRVLTGGTIHAYGLTTDSGVPGRADFTGISVFNELGAGGIVYADVINKNSGTANITTGNTSVVVTHGVGYTITAADIAVTPINSMGAATKFWISNAGATGFTINVDVDPAATASFAWSVNKVK